MGWYPFGVVCPQYCNNCIPPINITGQLEVNLPAANYNNCDDNPSVCSQVGGHAFFLDYWEVDTGPSGSPACGWKYTWSPTLACKGGGSIEYNFDYVSCIYYLWYNAWEVEIYSDDPWPMAIWSNWGSGGAGETPCAAGSEFDLPLTYYAGSSCWGSGAGDASIVLPSAP